MKRRDLINAVPALAGVTLFSPPLNGAAMTERESLTDLSAVAAVAAMKNGELTAEKYAHALLARAEATRSLNVFRTLDPDVVRESARAADRKRASGAPLGMLHGLPIPVKDSVNTRGVPTSNGTAALRDFRPRADAPLLTALYAQGAILMGKTNIHELSLGWTSNNMTFGAVKNPYDPTRIPGGSSGGSGAAVGARVAPLAIAEDTQGSIRIPSTMCGLTGLRPTYGRYPGEGILPITQDKFDQAGPVARNVMDLVLFDTAVTGDTSPLPQTSLRDVRIGIAPFFMTQLDAEVERIVARAMTKLEEAGAVVVTVEVPDAVKKAPIIAGTIQIAEALPALTEFLAKHADGITADAVIAQLGANVGALFKTAILPPNGIPSDVYRSALEQRERLKSAIAEHFREHRLDVLMFPPALVPPLPLGDNVDVEIAGAKVPLTTVMGRNTALGPCASLACLVLPGGLTPQGLPVGIEFDAMPATDRRLLSLGVALEAVLGPIPGPA